MVNWNIRNKLLLSFSCLLLLVMAASAVTIISSWKIEREAAFMNEIADMNHDISDNLKLSNSMVQQWFTDAAVTADPSALKEAEKHAGRFRQSIKEMPNRCKGCHEKTLAGGKSDVDVEAELKALADSFDRHYELGTRMVAAYLNQGREQGNAVMKDFDKSADDISRRLDSYLDMGKGHLDKSSKYLKSFTSNTVTIALWGTALVVLLTIGLAIFLSARIERVVSDVLNTADKIAKGDLSGSDMAVKAKDEISLLAGSLNFMKSALNKTIGRIASSSERMASSSEQLSRTVRNIRERMHEQASKAEQAATSTTEMSMTVVDIANNSLKMASSATDTLDVARAGADVVKRTVGEVKDISVTVSESAQFMTSLGNRSKQIGEIISVINDIADQTNLLALNAAIEAARAGEQGRGFAVVADEVRKLAERTSRATTEISAMIQAIQDETGRAVSSMNESIKRVELGVSLSNQAGDALGKILERISDLQTMVQHIASATEEMSTTAEMISSDIESIATAAKQTSAGSNEITQAADDMAKLSNELNDIARQFKTK